ncbi:MAG: CarD family transcriptional regulator [Clostridium sp.]
MFNIGDKVVYPNQGVGTIVNIEQKDFLGNPQDYYYITLTNNLKVMLPTSRSEKVGLRNIIDSNELSQMFSDLDFLNETLDSLIDKNGKERFDINQTKIKSGTFSDYLEVVSLLSKIKNEHSLNSSEKQMLHNTKKILVAEISASKDISATDATSLLDKSIQTIF